MANLLDEIVKRFHQAEGVAQQAIKAAPEVISAVTNPAGYAASKITSSPPLQPVQNFVNRQIQPPINNFIQPIINKFPSSPLGALVQGQPQQFLPRVKQQWLVQSPYPNPQNEQQRAANSMDLLKTIAGGFGPHGAGPLFSGGIKDVSQAAYHGIPILNENGTPFQAKTIEGLAQQYKTPQEFISAMKTMTHPDQILQDFKAKYQPKSALDLEKILTDIHTQATGGVNSREAIGNSQKILGSAETTTTPTTQTGKLLPGQESMGNGQADIPGASSPNDITTDPVQKIIQALKEAKPIRGEQEALYSAERAKRVARVAGAGNIPGEKGYFAQLGALKGELPKVQFEGIRNKLTQDDVNHVFNQVEQTPFFSPFEKVTAKTGLAKLLGKEGGAVPNKSELTLLNEVFPPEFIQAAMGNRSKIEKLWSAVGQVAAVPRSLMAGGLDMSYGLRQGVFSGYSHPKQWSSAFKEQFKYFGSEKAYQAAGDAIKADPLYKTAREAGLALTDLGTGKFRPREEQFQSALAEKIPLIGTAVKASGRSYTGFANKYRFDMFKSLVENAKRTGDINDPKFLKNAGELVNTLTGRGGLGKLEKAAGPLSTTLFSPRLLASRLQLMNPQFYLKLQPTVRKEALKSLVAYIAGTSTVLGAAKLAGADVNSDLTNSDFGKIKVGNTRVDIMGGFQQPLVLLARLITGKVTSSTTGKVMTLGEGYKPMTRFDIVQRFFESKEAPIISFISSLARGQDAIGNKFNLPTEVINRMVPMFISDLVDLYKDGGLSSLPLGIPAFFGAGSQTYGKTEMVTGKNQLGESTSQIRPVPGLAESLSEKVFGQQPLGSSSTTNVETYFDQLKKMPQEQKGIELNKIIDTNPDLAKQLIQVAKDRQMGITVEDKTIKGLGIASGDRATAVIKNIKASKTKEEKAKLFDHYISVGIITPEIANQMSKLLQKR